MVLASFGIVLNIAAGMVVDLLSIPLLFIDTIGTILVSVVLGPWVVAMSLVVYLRIQKKILRSCEYSHCINSRFYSNE